MRLPTARRLFTMALCAASFAAPAVFAQPGTSQINAQGINVQGSMVLRGGNSANGYLKIEGIDGESIMSPRDPASGLATGKRQHKPITAKTAIGVLEEFPVIVANPSSAKQSVVIVTLSMEGGGTCKARVPATYDANTKRLEVALGDAARFFDAAKRPRPNLCP